MSPRLRALASLGLAWHVCGLLIAPAPPSALAAVAWPVYRPYLERLGLNHAWGLFAPEPGVGRVVFAELSGPDGASTRLTLSPGRQAAAGALRRAALVNALSSEHPAHVHAVAAALCRAHPQVASIRLLGQGLAPVSPEAWAEGRRPPQAAGEPAVLGSRVCAPSQ